MKADYHYPKRIKHMSRSFSHVKNEKGDIHNTIIHATLFLVPKCLASRSSSESDIQYMYITLFLKQYYLDNQQIDRSFYPDL